MTQDDVDYEDMQGLVRFGYGALTKACYLLLRVRDARAAERGCAPRRHQRRALRSRPLPRCRSRSRRMDSRRSACRRR